MLQLLGLSSLLALAMSSCVPPPAPTSSPWPTTPLIQVPTNDGRTKYYCDPYSMNWQMVGNYGVGGSVVVDSSFAYYCDPAVGKLLSDNGKEGSLATLGCVSYPTSSGMCGFSSNSIIYGLQEGEKPDLKCPAGQALEHPDLGPVKAISCLAGATQVTLANGTIVPQIGEEDFPEVKCAVPKTTTTVATTTTTKKPDAHAVAAQLWTIYTYYNYGIGVHAFCADQACYNAIQKNGLGYDPSNGKVVMGRAISESQIASIRASCPTGSANLRNLAFSRFGNHYEHNLNGSGLKQGWVATTYMACGATLPIKKWKSRYTDDMMYGENLEWNTWYKGMVQDGGRVQYYLWY